MASRAARGIGSFGARGFAEIRCGSTSLFRACRGGFTTCGDPYPFVLSSPDAASGRIEGSLSKDLPYVNNRKALARGTHYESVGANGWTVPSLTTNLVMRLRNERSTCPGSEVVMKHCS